MALRLGPAPSLATAVREGLRKLAPFLRGSASKTAEVKIPLRPIAGGWLAEVILNDAKKARFLVDSGASVCVISPELADALGIEPEPETPPVSLQTLSGITTGPVVKIQSIRVGEAEAQDVLAVIHATGPSMDGILGNNFLSRFTLTLDLERGVLSLQPR